jgi:hypothetical protein
VPVVGAGCDADPDAPADPVDPLDPDAPDDPVDPDDPAVVVGGGRGAGGTVAGGN